MKRQVLKRQVFENVASLGDLMTIVMLFGYAGLAVAADGAPWESTLCGLAGWFRGGTALAIASIAFFAAGVSFLWGEEIAGISKKLVTIFMSVCVILGGMSVVGWIANKMGTVSTSCAV
jgi:type IV secretory pathway VirB2 component (pilin)